MRAAVKLRADYTAGHLRVLARRSSDAGRTRRLLAFAVIYEGGSRGGRRRRELSGVRLFGTGCWRSMPRGLMAC